VKRSLVAAVSLALSLLCNPVFAQPTATELFDSGLEAMKRGDYAAACPAIAESHRLEPSAGALFTLAECEARAGLVASAWTHFGEFLEMEAALEENERNAERIAAAEERHRELEPDLSRLTLTIPAALGTAGTELELDGAVVERTRWREPLLVDPGLHRLVLRRPGGDLTRIVQVERGRNYPVRFSAPPPPRKRAKPRPRPRRAPPEEGVRATWVAGWIALGVGVAGLGTAGAVGIVMLMKKESIEEHCVENRCDAEGFAEVDDVPTLDAVGIAAFVVGSVGAIAGVSLLVIDSTVAVTSDGRSAMISARW